MSRNLDTHRCSYHPSDRLLQHLQASMAAFVPINKAHPTRTHIPLCEAHYPPMQTTLFFSSHLHSSFSRACSYFSRTWETPISGWSQCTWSLVVLLLRRRPKQEVQRTLWMSNIFWMIPWKRGGNNIIAMCFNGFRTTILQTMYALWESSAKLGFITKHFPVHLQCCPSFGGPAHVYLQYVVTAK